MLVVDKPLAHEILVVLYVLVELFELPDLYAYDGEDEADEQQEGIEASSDENLRLNVGDEEGHDAMCNGIWHGQGQAEADDHRRGELCDDEAQIHLTYAVVVSTFDGKLQAPLRPHHRHGRCDFRVEHTWGISLDY